MSQYGEVGFEGRMLWLPSYLLDNPCDYSKVRGNVRNYSYQKQQRSHRTFPSELQSQYSKSTSRSSSYERPKHATGGPGMQAIFLGSGQRSCGTGVFLPQKAGTKPTNKKPACAPPVLLPARVIEALNLKVDALGLQITPPNQGLVSKPSEEVNKNNESTKKKNHPKIAQYRQRSSSHDIFLPKEWTY